MENRLQELISISQQLLVNYQMIFLEELSPMAKKNVIDRIHLFSEQEKKIYESLDFKATVELLDKISIIQEGIVESHIIQRLRETLSKDNHLDILLLQKYFGISILSIQSNSYSMVAQTSFSVMEDVLLLQLFFNEELLQDKKFEKFQEQTKLKKVELLMRGPYSIQQYLEDFPNRIRLSSLLVSQSCGIDKKMYNKCRKTIVGMNIEQILEEFATIDSFDEEAIYLCARLKCAMKTFLQILPKSSVNETLENICNEASEKNFPLFIKGMIQEVILSIDQDREKCEMVSFESGRQM